VKTPILDHGYIELVEAWGSDEAIIEAARMSTAKGFLGWGGEPCVQCSEAGRLSEKDHLFKTYEDSEAARAACACKGSGKTVGDEKLLRYLWTNKHSTPFEFAGMTVEVQAPLMVFREWHRHRTQSYSERSARYAPLPDSNYVPTVDRVMAGGGHLTKQAAAVDGAALLTTESALAWRAELADVYEHAERVYQSGMARGVPKELARLCVPVGRYSTMRASTDLRNWLAFAALRLPKTAQYEIRIYAEAVGALLAERFPRTWSLFAESLP
jgi:thymidylate synthase (FAD)